MELDEVYRTWQSLQPLTPQQRSQLSRKFSVDYNFNSNHIEGNTLTYGQTELLLMFGTVSGEGNLKDFNDMKASQVGLRIVEEEAPLKETKLTQQFIRELHRVLLREDYTVYRNLPGGVQTSYVIHAGQYKTRPNSVITRYGDHFEYASPEETPAMMTDLVDWYNAEEEAGKMTPVELAALFHYRYIRIHPFEDGNGRIARLMANYILARHDWPMVVVRNRNKMKYLDALHKTDEKIGDEPYKGATAKLKDIRPFLKYFIQMVTDEIQSNVDYLLSKDKNSWWYDGQEIHFRSKNGSQLLRLMKDNPDATFAMMSQQLETNISALQRLIDNMKEKGYVGRRADGTWHVFAQPAIEYIK